MQQQVFKIKSNIKRIQQRKGSPMTTICNQCIRYTIRWLVNNGIIYNTGIILHFYLFTIVLSSISNNFALILIQLNPFICKFLQLLKNLVIILTCGVLYYCTPVMYNVCNIFYCVALFFYFSN